MHYFYPLLAMYANNQDAKGTVTHWAFWLFGSEALPLKINN